MKTVEGMTLAIATYTYEVCKKKGNCVPSAQMSVLNQQ